MRKNKGRFSSQINLGAVLGDNNMMVVPANGTSYALSINSKKFASDSSYMIQVLANGLITAMQARPPLQDQAAAMIEVLDTLTQEVDFFRQFLRSSSPLSTTTPSAAASSTQTKPAASSQKSSSSKRGPAILAVPPVASRPALPYAHNLQEEQGATRRLSNCCAIQGQVEGNPISIPQQEQLICNEEGENRETPKIARDHALAPVPYQGVLAAGGDEINSRTLTLNMGDYSASHHQQQKISSHQQAGYTTAVVDYTGHENRGITSNDYSMVASLRVLSTADVGASRENHNEQTPASFSTDSIAGAPSSSLHRASFTHTDPTNTTGSKVSITNNGGHTAGNASNRNQRAEGLQLGRGNDGLSPSLSPAKTEPNGGGVIRARKRWMLMAKRPITHLSEEDSNVSVLEKLVGPKIYTKWKSFPRTVMLLTWLAFIVVCWLSYNPSTTSTSSSSSSALLPEDNGTNAVTSGQASLWRASLIALSLAWIVLFMFSILNYYILLLALQTFDTWAFILEAFFFSIAQWSMLCFDSSLAIAVAFSFFLTCCYLLYDALSLSAKRRSKLLYVMGLLYMMVNVGLNYSKVSKYPCSYIISSGGQVSSNENDLDVDKNKPHLSVYQFWLNRGFTLCYHMLRICVQMFAYPTDCVAIKSRMRVIETVSIPLVNAPPAEGAASGINTNKSPSSSTVMPVTGTPAKP